MDGFTVMQNSLDMSKQHFTFGMFERCREFILEASAISHFIIYAGIVFIVFDSI